jgi:hypothetical protein
MLNCHPVTRVMTLVNTKTYHGALTLNNIGVQLMELGSFEKALVTMLDSVKAFSLSVSEDPASWCMVENKIQNASIRLQNEKESRGGKVVMESLLYTRCQDISILRQPELLPVRICQPDTTSNQFVAVGSDHHLDAAIVLCNAALSFYLVSKETPVNSTVQESLITKTYKMLDLADTVIGRQFGLVCDSDPFDEIRLYVVAQFVVATRMRVSAETGRLSEAAALFYKFQRLGNAIQQTHEQSSVQIASE